ncbi:hypothetical protein Tco_0706721 [Tanacetum coccineum]|uniref:Uncharacterized protein n=1 Tax=Tanacetum coccineum TaxID=301880 RepID=A0ABQ4Y926_9ASTR
MHTTMILEQVKTMMIQAGVQVSRLEELRRHLQLWKRFGRLYFVAIVLDRNILELGLHRALLSYLLPILDILTRVTPRSLLPLVPRRGSMGHEHYLRGVLGYN